jgi:hypothetical protein
MRYELEMTIFDLGKREVVQCMCDLIEAHHQRMEVKPLVNRKQVPIDKTIQVPDDPTAFPWGRAPQEEA